MTAYDKAIQKIRDKGTKALNAIEQRVIFKEVTKHGRATQVGIDVFNANEDFLKGQHHDKTRHLRQYK